MKPISLGGALLLILEANQSRYGLGVAALRVNLSPYGIAGSETQIRRALSALVARGTVTKRSEGTFSAKKLPELFPAQKRSKMPHGASGGINIANQGPQSATYKPQTTADPLKTHWKGGFQTAAKQGRRPARIRAFPLAEVGR